MITISAKCQLADAVRDVADGETIQIGPGDYSITPPIPANIEDQPNKGAALPLVNKHRVTIQGVGDPIIRTTRHGSLFGLIDCSDITMRGFVLEGNGYLSDQSDWYFAMILLHGDVARPRFENLVVREFGNHGIGHLLGGMTHHGIFRDCQFLRGGTIGGKRDGAAIANGGSDNSYEGLTMRETLVGLELETKYPHDTKGNICRGLRVYKPLWRPVFIYPSHGDASRFYANQLVDTYIDGEGSRAEYGIGVHGGTNLQLRGGHICNMDGAMGILLGEQACDISGTMISGFRISGEKMATGIHIAQNNDKSITGGLVTGNNIGPLGQGRGIWLDASGFAVVSNVIGRRDLNPQGDMWEAVYQASDWSNSNAVSGNVDTEALL